MRTSAFFKIPIVGLCVQRFLLQLGERSTTTYAAPVLNPPERSMMWGLVAGLGGREQHLKPNKLNGYTYICGLIDLV
jgi:hypothetical protein